MCGSLVSIFSMICVFVNRHRIWEIVVMLEDAMKKFRKIQVRPDFKRNAIKFAILSFVSIFMVILGLILMAMLFGYNKKPIYLVVYGYLSASFSVMLGWSSMVHLSIYLRLNLINKTIK